MIDATRMDRGEKALLYAPELRARLDGADPYAVHRGHLNAVRAADFVNHMLYLDLKTFMVSLNLTYNDKMSMAASLEVRVPFLDRELAEYAFAEVPPDWKVTRDLPPAHEVRAEAGARWNRPGRGADGSQAWVRRAPRPLARPRSPGDGGRSPLRRPDSAAQPLPAGERPGCWSGSTATGAGTGRISSGSSLTLELWQRAFLDR